eukprot:symbB.v1.2.011772.t1/scaffold750.1/size323489/24
MRKRSFPGHTMSADRGTWFQRIFGFSEASYDKTREMLAVEEDEEKPGMSILRSLANGARFRIGCFGTPSLQELRQVLEADVPSGRLKVTNEIGDVAYKHALPENMFATFQVASQFNCLEFVGPSVVPEDGITSYVHDRTQGPACSIACGPATAFRNFFAPVGPTGQQGQRKELQINNLDDFSTTLDVLCQDPADATGYSLRPAPFFHVRSGYTEASHREMQRLNRALARLSEAQRDALRATLRVGVHEEVQVTSHAWGAKLLPTEQLVTQVFGSACSVAYNRDSSRDDWQPVATLILEASYEATLLAALKQAKKHAGKGGSKKVFLTSLGGGVFGNSMEWITQAMERAFHQLKDVDLDVRIVTYAGSPHPELPDRCVIESQRVETRTQNNRAPWQFPPFKIAPWDKSSVPNVPKALSITLHCLVGIELWRDILWFLVFQAPVLEEMQTSRFSSSTLSGPVLLGEDGGTYWKQITHLENEAAR